MSTRPNRRAIHAYLSHAAHDHWHDFAAAHGVSVSAILEALATDLGTSERIAPVMDGVVTNARQIDAQRRQRTNR